MLYHFSSAQETMLNVHVVKLYQIKISLLQSKESVEQDSKLLNFLCFRLLDDKMPLNPAYYEQTASLRCRHTLTESQPKAMRHVCILNEVFRQFNVGELRATHPSYSLSVNDVVEIDGVFYRVSTQGFETLTDWNQEIAETISLNPKLKANLQPKLSNETTESPTGQPDARCSQDYQFDVFVYIGEPSNTVTFIEDYAGESWYEQDLATHSLATGRLYPANTNVSPFQLKQHELYMITYLDSQGRRHAFNHQPVHEVIRWLQVPAHKQAYQEKRASIYIQDAFLSLSAYKGLLDLHLA